MAVNLEQWDPKKYPAEYQGKFKELTKINKKKDINLSRMANLGKQPAFKDTARGEELYKELTLVVEKRSEGIVAKQMEEAKKRGIDTSGIMDEIKSGYDPQFQWREAESQLTELLQKKRIGLMAGEMADVARDPRTMALIDMQNMLRKVGNVAPLRGVSNINIQGSSGLPKPPKGVKSLSTLRRLLRLKDSGFAPNFQPDTMDPETFEVRGPSPGVLALGREQGYDRDPNMELRK